MLRIFSLVLLCSLSVPLYAQSETESTATESPAETEPGTEVEEFQDNKLTGEGGLGMTVNRGNTENESLNAKLRLVYEVARWQHQFSIDARKTTENETTIGERYLFTEKTDYDISERTYAFGAFRYDDDRFSGFQYQSSLTTGIGWHVIDSDKTKLDLEVGAGHKESKLRNDSMVEEETIGRLGEHYETRLSESTRVIQDLLVESGNKQTTTEFNTALNVAMNSHLALQLSFGIKRTSNPPPGLEDTDSITSINLIYNFSGHE